MPRENFPHFQCLNSCAKEPGAFDVNDFWHSWLILDSVVSWKRQDKIFNAFSALPPEHPREFAMLAYMTHFIEGNKKRPVPP